MYLMDALTRVAKLISAREVRPGLSKAAKQWYGRDEPLQDLSEVWLQSYISLAERLNGAPRFLFDANAIRTAVEISLGRPKIIRETMEHLRSPYPKLWVEWADADRQRLRDKFDEDMSYKELRPLPGRVGFLLETDQTGRSGTATWAWTTPGAGDEFPNIGAVQPYFDLDQRFELSADRVEGLMKGNLASLWSDNPVQLDALYDIWRTARHLPSPAGLSYWESLGNEPLVIALSYSDTVGEYIMLWATLLMLTASRPVVELKPVDLGKLNKARKRRGNDLPLLDYTTVSLRLTPTDQRPVISRESGYNRKSPRIHYVSRYLARRGDKHWLVEPYIRGSGEWVNRHVNVKG